MGSRREEERNEKIIRGLMKLPPNRRCINCNSLGPQYVCTNFWTFVCVACSGIHREFTHRVKSVSMAKFTSQEVEALQNGGNQRAREMYLKNWDHLRQRLPDSSNADKVRDFIKSVYVAKKYAGANPSDKPPTDSQVHRNSEDVTRRASSYHSYSQSPPYDYQYEERRYGKQVSGFTSKSASERGHHVKASSFVYSPGHFSDHIFEDRFANDVFAPRASDFSVSSGGDPFRSETQSPNFQKDVGFSSPQFLHSKVPPNENLQHQTTISFPDGQHQRTTSLGSVRSFDSNSLSTKSYNSSSLADAVSEIDQSAGIHQDKTSTPASSATYGGLDLFSAPITPEAVPTKSPSIDLFQLPEAPVAQSVNTFLPSTGTQALPGNSYQPPQTYPSQSIDLFAGILDRQPTSKPSDLLVLRNEGWATFDSPQSAGKPSVESITSGFPQLDSSAKTEGTSHLGTSMHWPAFQSSNANQPAMSIPNPWHNELSGIPNTVVPTSSQPWDAFLNSIKDTSLENDERFGEPTGETSNPSCNVDQQHLGLRVVEDSGNDGSQRALDDATGFRFPENIFVAPSHSPSTVAVTEEAWLHANNHRSTNPFDLPYDPELEPTDTFLDMSSLQAALPNIQPPPTFITGASQPWFPTDTAASYVSAPAGTQGGLAYMGGQATTSQLQNLPQQGPVASIGGNPFA